MTTARPRVSARRQRGASLLESLIAFVVLAGGTVAVAQLQGHLRLGGDLARQRSEAVRLGEAEMERLRAFPVVAAASGAGSYEAIAAAESVVTGSNAEYHVARSVDDAAIAGAKALAVRVAWTDRSGTTREVAMSSFIAGIDPAYAGSLALGAGAVPSAPRGAFGRAPTVPVEARDLGDGRSVWKPAAAATVAVLFDNSSGAVVGRCDVAATTATRDLGAADLAACAGGRWQLVTGTIRFTAAVPPAPGAARDVPPAVGVALALTDGTYPATPTCTTEARKTVRYVAGGSLRIEAVAIDAVPASVGIAEWDDSGDRFVAWSCLVAPRADGRWSGRAALVAGAGWTIGGGSAERRVCRYAADADGSGAVDSNVEHPDTYRDVAATLPAQNFLVVRGDAACPAAPAVRLTGEGSVVQADLGTVAHQP